MKSGRKETVLCSNPACMYEFEVAVEKLGRNIRCPGCGQIITARPLSVWLAMEKQQRRLAGLGVESGVKDRKTVPLTGVLDDIRSLLNVGSVFRTADGAGLRELVLCGITGAPEPPNSRLKKTALGAEKSVPWRYFARASEALENLKNEGCLIVALEQAEDSIPFFDWLRDGLPQIDSPIALMAGNEVAGVGAEAAEFCDVFLELPMYGVKQSLNVAVAFGISAYCISDALHRRNGSFVDGE